MLVMWNRGASVTLEPHGFGGIGIGGGGGGGGRGPGTSQFVHLASLFGRRAPQGSLNRTANTVDDAFIAEQVAGNAPSASKPAQADLLLHHAVAPAMLMFALNILPPASSPTRQIGVMASARCSEPRATRRLARAGGSNSSSIRWRRRRSPAGGCIACYAEA
eukprot:SAG31_NODE_1027_length_10273_cov_50.715746_1_plen_162_part_00